MNIPKQNYHNQIYVFREIDGTRFLIPKNKDNDEILIIILNSGYQASLKEKASISHSVRIINSHTKQIVYTGNEMMNRMIPNLRQSLIDCGMTQDQLNPDIKDNQLILC